MKHIIILVIFFTLCSFIQEPTTRIEYYIIQTSPRVFDTVMVEVDGKPIWLYKNGKRVTVKIYHYDTILHRNKPKMIKG